MRHIVICWEMGGGLGHVIPLSRIAVALMDQGFRVSFVMKDISQAPKVLGPLGIRWLQAPGIHATARPPLPINHADILHAGGYDCANNLHALLGGWQALFSLLRPDRVICEYAPTARLAANSLGLDVVSLDEGFGIPPVGTPMPALREEMQDTAKLLASEQRTLAVINQTLERMAVPPLPDFAAMFRTKVWYRNWYELNHFGPHSPERHLGPVLSDSEGAPPVWPAGSGPKLFAYLKAGHARSLEVLQAAVSDGYRVSAYLAGFPAAALEPLHATGRVSISTEPVRLSDLDDDVEIGVWHSAIGSAVRCLEKGMGMLFLPIQVEQYRAGMAVRRAGLPAIVVTQSQDWSSAFATLRAMPRFRLAGKWMPADVAHMATVLATH